MNCDIDKYNSKYKYDHELVEGIFYKGLYHKTVEVKFLKYKDDPVLYFTFTNGEDVKIPRMVAEALYQQSMFSLKKAANEEFGLIHIKEIK